MKSTTTYKAILFDLDGTIVNTIGDITFAMNKALNQYNIEPLSDEEGMMCVGRGLRNALKEAVRLRGKEVKDKELDHMVTLLFETYSQYPFQFAKEYEGTSQFLQKYVNKGVLLGVLSNKDDELVKVIVDELFPDIPFSFVLGAHSDYPLKPDPTSLLSFMDKFDLRAEDLLFIGDSEVDGRTGEASGVRVALVSWGFRNKDALIASGFTNIYDTFEELEKGEL